MDFMIGWICAFVVVAVAFEVLKLIWKFIRIRVLGWKPAGLDEEQLARTVAYCTGEYMREMKRLNAEDWHLDEDDERKMLSDMEKYTSFVVLTYLDGAKA